MQRRLPPKFLRSCQQLPPNSGATPGIPWDKPPQISLMPHRWPWAPIPSYLRLPARCLHPMPHHPSDPCLPFRLFEEADEVASLARGGSKSSELAQTPTADLRPPFQLPLLCHLSAVPPLETTWVASPMLLQSNC